MATQSIHRLQRTYGVWVNAEFYGFYATEAQLRNFDLAGGAATAAARRPTMWDYFRARLKCFFRRWKAWCGFRSAPQLPKRRSSFALDMI